MATLRGEDSLPGWKVRRPVLCPSPKTIAGIASAVILSSPWSPPPSAASSAPAATSPPAGAQQLQSLFLQWWVVRPCARRKGRGALGGTGGQEVWLAAAGPSGHTPARLATPKPELQGHV